MGPVARYDFTLVQGSTHEITFAPQDANGTAIDLTGATARMQARPSHDSADVLLSLATGGSGIVIASNEITVTISATTSAAVSRSGVYDLEVIFSDSTVQRIVEGCMDVSPEVTR